jgi:glucan biosynthesis protein C
MATGLMLGRPGLGDQRAKRLFLPLLFGVAFVVPPQAYFQVQQQMGFAGSYLEFLRLYCSGLNGFCQADQSLRWPALLIACVAWAMLVGFSAHVAAWPGVPEIMRLPMRFVFAAEQWCAIVAAFGFARRHLNRDHRWRAALNEAVLALYIVQQTLIIVGAVALAPLTLPVGLEALILVAGTLAGGLAAWQLARRLPWLRPWMGLGPNPATHRVAAASA